MTWHSSIEFPAPAERLNLNWAKRAEITKAWRTAAFIACRNAGMRDLAPSLVKVTFTVRTSARRDPSNLIPTVKACVDGMVDAGAWPDDNSEWVAVLEPAIVVVKSAAPSVRVECWPMLLKGDAA